MNLVWTACGHVTSDIILFNVTTTANIIFHVIPFSSFAFFTQWNPHLKICLGTGFLYLKLRKKLRKKGHRVKMKQKIITMFAKAIYTVCSEFTLNDVSPQSILYFHIYCMGQEKTCEK